MLSVFTGSRRQPRTRETGAVENRPFGVIRSLPEAPHAIAPDGMEVRLLTAGGRGSMAHFRLGPQSVGRAVRHATVDEMWFVTAGSAELWRMIRDVEEVMRVETGDAFDLPVGTSFQLRNNADAPFDAVGVTMPPWPGDHEATVVPGRWTPAV
jgi:mannose-6-phosphate isomerase-like protein (cupin superfamily)